MKAQGQIGLRPEQATVATRVARFLPSALAWLAGSACLARSYVVRELLLFVSFAAVLVLLGASVAVLGVLLHQAGRSIFRSVRIAKTGIARPEEVHAESEADSLVGSPVLRGAIGTDSS